MSEDVVGLIVLLFSLALLPAVCIFVTRQAAEGRMAPNAAAGIRTRHTQASDEAWVAGHRAALPAMRWMWSVAVIGGVIAVGAQILAGTAAAMILGLATFLVLMVIVIKAAMVADRAARTV